MNIDTNGGNPELVDRFALGYMEIVAAIDKMPSVNDSVLSIKTVSDQLFGDTMFVLDEIKTFSYGYGYGS
jgi:hypothetical protein